MDETMKRVQDIDEGWERLTITNDFVFCKAMLNVDLCREVLEAILQVPIERIEYVGRQEVLDTDVQNKGVRLDVYVRDDEGTVYNVEMQSTDTYELPQRTRYYQALMALDQINRGEAYTKLKGTFVIFICGFDPFKDGRRVYLFENTCQGNPTIRLGDGARTVFLAATAPHENDVSDRLNELLDYVSSGAVSGELSERLDAEVARVLDNKKWRLEYMIQQVREQLSFERGEASGFEKGEVIGLARGEQIGLEKGEAVGLAKGEQIGLEKGEAVGLAKGEQIGLEKGEVIGLAKGEQIGLAKGEAIGFEKGREEGTALAQERFARLASALHSAGRDEDFIVAVTDPEHLERLCTEYGIA